MTDEVDNVKEYPPGSEKARDAGCVCPVIDNRYGRGYYGAPIDSGIYVMTDNCPLHGETLRAARLR